MARRKQAKVMYSEEQEDKEAIQMLLSLMQTGECIGRLDFCGTRYQLWDYKTSQQSKLPGDIIVGIFASTERLRYMFIKRSMLVRLD